MERRRVYSGIVWESTVGYCRALRVGDCIYVSGTAPIDPVYGVHAPNDAYAQTRYCLETIQKALQELGADLKDVVRTRLYVTDIVRAEDYGRAHRELFGEHPPASAMVEVHSLIDPMMLVEIEADAICSSPQS